MNGVLTSDAYDSLVKSFCSDKRKVFSDLKGSLKGLQETLIELLTENYQLPTTPKLEREIILIIKNLSKQHDDFITYKNQKISKNSKFNPVMLAIDDDRYDEISIRAVQEAYKALIRGKTQAEFTNLALEKLRTLIEENTEETKNEEPIIDLLGAVLDELHEVKEQFLRPILVDSINFSLRNFEISTNYHSASALFCYLRLIHCSAKRSIKNLRHDDFESFDGVVFSRSWQFNEKITITEIQTLSCNKSVTSMVLYPYDNSYQKLLEKLLNYQDKLNIDDNQVVDHIKSILKFGKLLNIKGINLSYEQFLTTFVYHIFCTEVERHPATAIHIVVGLDLIKMKIYSWEDFFCKLPMTISDAVPTERAIQISLKSKLKIPYYYDKCHSIAKETKDESYKQFILLEKELMEAWLSKKGYNVNEINKEIISDLNDLCFEYYEIKLSGDLE